MGNFFTEVEAYLQADGSDAAKVVLEKFVDVQKESCTKLGEWLFKFGEECNQMCRITVEDDLGEFYWKYRPKLGTNKGKHFANASKVEYVMRPFSTSYQEHKEQSIKLGYSDPKEYWEDVVGGNPEGGYCNAMMPWVKKPLMVEGFFA